MPLEAPNLYSNQNMEYREYIAHRRKQLGLSQGDLAAALGYTDTAISKIESGMSYPPISVLPLLADQLHVSLKDFLDKNENPAPFQGKNPPYLSEVVGRNIRALRLHLHLRQGEAAERIGVSKRTLITYEKGDACPSLAVLEKILADCPADPDLFFYGVLFPEVQASPSFNKRGPNPWFFALGGVLVGAGLLSAVLLPMRLSPSAGDSSSEGQGSFGYVSSTSTSSQTSENISSSAPLIKDLDQLWVTTEDGLAWDAAMLPSATLKLTVFTGQYSQHERDKTVFEFSLADAPSGVSLTTTSSATATLKSENAPTGSVFTVNLAAHTLANPTVVQTGIPLMITVNSTGTL